MSAAMEKYSPLHLALFVRVCVSVGFDSLLSERVSRFMRTTIGGEGERGGNNGCMTQYTTDCGEERKRTTKAKE